MKCQPTAAFDTVNRYLGWGEPIGGIWFVGLEESKGWANHTPAEIARSCGDGEYSPSEPPEDWSQLGHSGKGIRDTTCKIVQPLSRTGYRLSWEEYRDAFLWAPGSQLFQANLFPIGKPKRKSWNPAFEALFGFCESQLQQYERYVAETRFKKITALWRRSRAQATICFGQEGWKHFRTIFALTSNPVEVVANKIYVHAEERVVLTPFFAYGHVTDEHTRLVTEILRSWEVSIA